MSQRWIADNKLDMAGIFAAFQHRPAVRTHGTSPAWTYAQLAAELNGLRRRFKLLGIQPGSRVALYAENDVFHLLIFLLAWIADFVFIPLNFRLPPVRAVADANPDFLISRTPVKDLGNCRFIPLDSLTATPGGRGALEVEPVDLDRECTLVYTSGSTGNPKGVVHTVGNYVYSALGAIEFFRLAPEHRWLISLPLFHVGGLSILPRTLLCGASAVLPRTLGEVDAAIHDRACDILSLVPTQLARFVKSEPTREALAAMHLVLLGGAPPPRWLLDTALDASVPVSPSYGSTESCSLLTAVPPGSDRAFYDTAGRLLPHRGLKMDAGGRLLLGGRTCFKHYVIDGMKVLPFKQGWFRTSDLGYVDGQGCLVVTGRVDEVFISGGENINPFEIEKCLMAISEVRAAVVIPVPHDEYGQVPWAFISTEGSLEPDAIVLFLRRFLPGYKIPKRILFIDSRESGLGIKLDRRAFRDKAALMVQEEIP